MLHTNFHTSFLTQQNRDRQGADRRTNTGNHSSHQSQFGVGTFSAWVHNQHVNRAFLGFSRKRGQTPFFRALQLKPPDLGCAITSIKNVSPQPRPQLYRDTSSSDLPSQFDVASWLRWSITTNSVGTVRKVTFNPSFFSIAENNARASESEANLPA